jgi:hypothetical protein
MLQEIVLKLLCLKEKLPFKYLFLSFEVGRTMAIRMWATDNIELRTQLVNRNVQVIDYLIRAFAPLIVNPIIVQVQWE